MLPDIDPLKRPPPSLETAASFEPDLRPAVEKIVPTLREEMAKAQAGAVIDVIVTLQEPALDTELTPGTQEHDELRAQHIASLEHAFATEASFYGFDAKRGLKHSPVVSGSIAVDSIEAVAGLPMVRAIESDLPVEAARLEGGGLISAFDLQDFGGEGEGIGVAVLDTGIDWTHPELTGQVTAGGDFTGTQTSNYGFDDGGHGTSCAGIIAGLQYGMAPGAHLWAMKVLDSTGNGSQAGILAALDEVYEFRNDFGGVHFVNMSLGGGAPINYICDADLPSYAAALGQLVGAGIAVFVSSGNDGCSNGIAIPACVSHAISVGAVYDADVGSPYFDPKACMPLGCLDLSTEADMITCYSNSGTYLDLLAPSHCANTTKLGGGYESCFGGTSAAAPYATGVAAQILSSRPSTTPAQLRQAFRNTGRPITDLRNGVTRNRIDAVQAYQYLAGGGCTYNISPTSASYGASGGNGSFAVTTQAGCTWNAAANNSWIHITAGASGTGNGTVSYSVDANGSSGSRTGTISAAGRTFTITQSGSGGGASCTDDLQHGVVCLLDNRFEFQMTWTGFDGVTQPVLFARASDQTAAGVFQNNLNDITLVVKVTTGCSFNNHYWVWLGGFTNAAWRLQVTDTETGRSHVYTKALSSTPPQTVKDETSFPCGSLAEGPDHGETAFETMAAMPEGVWGELLEDLPGGTTDPDAPTVGDPIGGVSQHVRSGSLPAVADVEAGLPNGGGSPSEISSRSIAWQISPVQTEAGGNDEGALAMDRESDLVLDVGSRTEGLGALPADVDLSEILENGLELEGTVRYEILSHVEMWADRITNYRPAGSISGTIRLELWATSNFPVFGPPITHHILGGYSLGQLEGGYYWYDIYSGTLTYSPPPTGCYWITMALLEYTTSGYAYQDLRTFDERVGFGTTCDTHTLTVTRQGSGTGTVTSSPPGINCGADCSEAYAAGTPVTLTAQPGSGSRFDGWGGACSGSSPTCSVTMSSDRSVTATFSPSGGGGSCTDDLQHGVVCLLDNRFEFQMTWTGFDGVTQPVLFVRASDQTAAGVFQNNLNDITLVVKVTTGCSFNNHYWVWLGGFTNAAWRLEVTDTETGRSHVYTKALSSTPPQTVKDETNFPCP